MPNLEKYSCPVCGSVPSKLTKVRYNYRFQVVTCQKCWQAWCKLHPPAKGLSDTSQHKDYHASCALCCGRAYNENNVQFLRCSSTKANCKLLFCTVCVRKLSSTVSVDEILRQQRTVGPNADKETIIKSAWKCFYCDPHQFTCPRYSEVQFRALRNRFSKVQEEASELEYQQFQNKLLSNASKRGNGIVKKHGKRNENVSDVNENTSDLMQGLLAARFTSNTIANAMQAEQPLRVAPAQHDRDYRTGRDAPNEHLNVAPMPFTTPAVPPYPTPPPPSAPPPPFPVQPPPPGSSGAPFSGLMANLALFGNMPSNQPSEPAAHQRANPLPGGPSRAFQPGVQPFVSSYPAQNSFGQQHYNPQNTYFNNTYAQQFNNSNAVYPQHHASRNVAVSGSAVHRDGTAMQGSVTLRPEQVMYVARGALKRCETFTNRLREFAGAPATSTQQTVTLCAVLNEFLRFFANVEELEQLGRFETAPVPRTTNALPQAPPVVSAPAGLTVVTVSQPGRPIAPRPAEAPVATVTTASGLSVSVAANEVQIAGIKLDWEREVGNFTFGQLSSVPNAARLRSILERYANVSMTKFGTMLYDIVLSPRSRREAQRERERATSAPPLNRRQDAAVADNNAPQPSVASLAVASGKPTEQAADDSLGDDASAALPAKGSAVGASIAIATTFSTAQQTPLPSPAAIATPAATSNSIPAPKPARVGTMSKWVSPKRGAALQLATRTQQPSTTGNPTHTIKNYCIPKTKPGSNSNNLEKQKHNGLPSKSKDKHSNTTTNAGTARTEQTGQSDKTKDERDKEKENEKNKEQLQSTSIDTTKPGSLKMTIKKPITVTGTNGNVQLNDAANKQHVPAKQVHLKHKLKHGDKSKLHLPAGPQHFLSSASSSESDVESLVRVLKAGAKRRRITSSSSSSSSSSLSSDSHEKKERRVKEERKQRAREAEQRQQRELQERLQRELTERRERERASEIANQTRRFVERPPGGPIRFKKGTFKQNSRCSVGLFDAANIEPSIFITKSIDLTRWNKLVSGAAFVPPSGGIRIPPKTTVTTNDDSIAQLTSTQVPTQTQTQAPPELRNGSTDASAPSDGTPKSSGKVAKEHAVVNKSTKQQRVDDDDPFREVSRVLNGNGRRAVHPVTGAAYRSRSNTNSSQYVTPNASDVDQLDGKNDKRTPTRRNAPRLNELAALRAELEQGDSDTDSATHGDIHNSESEVNYFSSPSCTPLIGESTSAAQLDAHEQPLGKRRSQRLQQKETEVAYSMEEDDDDENPEIQELRAVMDDDSDDSDDEEPATKPKRAGKRQVVDDSNIEGEIDPNHEINPQQNESLIYDDQPASVATQEAEKTDVDGEQDNDATMQVDNAATVEQEQEQLPNRRTPLRISLGGVPLVPPIGLPKRRSGAKSSGQAKRSISKPQNENTDELYDDDLSIEEDESSQQDMQEVADTDSSSEAGLALRRPKSGAAKKDAADTKPDTRHARKHKASVSDKPTNYEVIDLLSDSEEQSLSVDGATTKKKKKQKPVKKPSAAKLSNESSPEDDDQVDALPCSQRSSIKATKRVRRVESDSEDFELSGIESSDEEVVLISSDSEQLAKSANAQADSDSDAEADADATTKPKAKRGKLRRVVLEPDTAASVQPASGDDSSSEKPKRRVTRRNANPEETQEERRERLDELRKARMKKLAEALLGDGDEEEGEADRQDAISTEAETTALLGLYRTSKSDKQKLLTISRQHRLVEQVERERIERIRERQRVYNEVHTANRDAQNRLMRLILEKDLEPPVEVAQCLVRRLKDHQAKVIEFMYSNLYVSLDHSRSDPVGSGCIVAHCMGLGKTLSVISFVHTILTRPELYNARTALILTPYNTINNWDDEWRKWFEVGPDEEQPPMVKVINMHSRGKGKQQKDRVQVLQQWNTQGHVLILSYDTFRNLVLPQGGRNCKSKRKRANAKAIPAHITSAIERFLCDPGPDLVVCDEGHVMKNIDSAVAQAVFKIRTRRRIVLTGTPLQNHLKEYHCMVSFCKEHLLGPLSFFRYQFVQPITAGQHKDSTEWQVKLMKKRAHVLNQKLKSCIDRRDVDELKRFLPVKFEYTIYVRYSRLQADLYLLYLSKYPPPKHNVEVVDEASRRAGQKKLQSTRLFADHRRLMLVNAHPYALHLSAVRLAEKRPLDDFVATSSDDSEGDSDDENNTVRKRRRGAQANKASTSRAANGEEEEQRDPEDDRIDPYWWKEVIADAASIKFMSDLSGKFVLLLDIIRMCDEIGDKLLVFSQSLVTLDLIEFFLEHASTEALRARSQATASQEPSTSTDNPAPNTSWNYEQDYLRIDGATDVDTRKRYIDRFNDMEDTRCRLFLISVKAGGLGINLCAANRIVLFDVSWNPATDAQALFRSYRLGQTKPVFVYRLVSESTMEHKIYNRCIVKSSLAKRVVDAHQIERYYTQADLQELYRFEPDLVDDVQVDQSPSWPVPKDRMLGDLLSTRSSWIARYQEHESLLENKVEEDLTEEERAQAWREFESERRQEKQKSIATRIGEACRLAAQGMQLDLDAIPEATPYVNTVRHVRTLLLQQPSAIAFDRIYQMLRTNYEDSPPLDEALARMISSCLLSNLILRNLPAGAANANQLGRIAPLLAASASTNTNVSNPMANLAQLWNNRAHPDRASLLADIDRHTLELLTSNGAVLPHAPNRLMMQQLAARRAPSSTNAADSMHLPRIATQNVAGVTPLGSNDEATAIEISDDNEDEAHSSDQPSPETETDVVIVPSGTETVHA